MSEVSSLIGLDDVPEAVRSRSTLVEPDYIDLFTVETPAARQHSPEAWARAVLERAPLARRNARALWRLIGLRLGPRGSADHVQGWKIADRGDDWIRVETSSWYLGAQAVCLVEDRRVSISLALRYEHSPARLVWALVERPHQRAVPVMLHQAAKLMAH